jgi:hypothetical protein
MSRPGDLLAVALQAKSLDDEPQMAGVLSAQGLSQSRWAASASSDVGKAHRLAHVTAQKPMMVVDLLHIPYSINQDHGKRPAAPPPEPVKRGK